jgi:uncharacterized alpha-E superfamily protein
MLSRVANSIYWMSRYVERAENIARFIDVTLQVLLDQPEGTGEQWEPLVRTTGDEKYFAKHYGDFSAANVLQFLTFDGEYPNSILTSLRNARENARTIREAISSESWEQLNSYYHFVSETAKNRAASADPEFYDSIRQHSQLFSGILDATMTRGTGWHFNNIGSLLERADKTSRILDVKYFTLLRDFREIDTTFDDLLWSAVLRSVSGFEMFRKRHHTLTIHRVVDFLILERRFPRAIRYCLEQVRHSLEHVAGPVSLADNLAVAKVKLLIEKLDGLDAQGIIDGGMHEFIDGFQSQLNELGGTINETYFAARSFDHSVKPFASQLSQSQS